MHSVFKYALIILYLLIYRNTKKCPGCKVDWSHEIDEKLLQNEGNEFCNFTKYLKSCMFWVVKIFKHLLSKMAHIIIGSIFFCDKALVNLVNTENF